MIEQLQNGRDAMQSIQLSTGTRPTRRFNTFDKTSVGTFGLGTFVGILAVTMWQQWSLTFGYDPQLLLVIALVLSVRFWLGQGWYLSTAALSGKQSIASLVYCLAAWSMLFPFWVDSLTTFTSFLPIGYLENEFSKTLLFFALAVLGWAIPGMLWSALFLHLGIVADENRLSKRRTFALLLSGVAVGLALNSIVLPSWFGYFVPTIAISIVACAIARQMTRRLTGEKRTASVSATMLWDDDQIETWIRSGMACLIGILLACQLRLSNQLMPHAAFVFYAQFAGVTLGVAIGLTLAAFRPGIKNRAVWSGLHAALASIALYSLHSQLVSLSLWMNASFSIVASLLVARFLLLAAIAFPFGLCLAWIADNKTDDVDHRLITWATPFSIGLAVGMHFLIGSIEVVPLMTICCLVMSAGALFVQLRSTASVPSWRTIAALACIVIVAGSMPAWGVRNHASRTAKLLYSAPAFVAYRSGWSTEQLPMLDDARLIDRREGRTGPLTLWRGRVDELYVRDTGILRGAVTKNANALPQFPAEVLQAVYPLVIHEQPARVLLLGLTSGVNLSTSLSFPIREAVCFESDRTLIDLVRGPLKRETGYDPFDDDRVTLKQISPELALATKPDPTFDVILCSSAMSSLAEGSPCFTTEFYRRAAGQLAEHGIFCQRFEGIDFGPNPLRLVLKSLHSAFRTTMAIETMAGELLLLASNTDDAFAVNKLESRLEMPHVRKVLARSGLDWSAPLNMPAYDHEALKEICDESRDFANSTIHGQLSARSILELLRWGNKAAEVQAVLTANRTTEPVYQTESEDAPKRIEGESYGPRRSRIVEWMGHDASAGLKRRLGEIAAQQNLVRERPDDHWWAYRRVLRKQLQNNPRSAIQQIKAVDQKRTMHPEDAHRRDYFLALSRAATVDKPTREQILKLETFLEPFDPLVSYFGRQETADLLERAGEDPEKELVYRLHVIFFAPAVDASVRNVAKAIETVVNHPETIPDDAARFDALNGLIQTLRVRWEIRQTGTETSSKKILEDIDQSLVAVEKGVSMMDGLVMTAQLPEQDWKIRRNVIERLMLRPLRTYRSNVEINKMRGEAAAHAAIEEANRDDSLDIDENADL